MEVIIPISRFRMAFDAGATAVKVLTQEVAGKQVRFCVDENCSPDDLHRYMRWCVSEGMATESIFDPLSPGGQMVCGNPRPRSYSLLTNQ